jgi:hypothetical protein
MKKSNKRYTCYGTCYCDCTLVVHAKLAKYKTLFKEYTL